MRAAEVALTAAQRAILESLSRSRTRAQRIVERATMIVMAAEGLADAEQARRLGVNEQRPRRWRGRWRAAASAVDAAEASGATSKEQPPGRSTRSIFTAEGGEVRRGMGAAYQSGKWWTKRLSPPCFMRSTLKLSSRPRCRPDSLR